jgi:hypothetical protein
MDVMGQYVDEFLLSVSVYAYTIVWRSCMYTKPEP